jgi:hypothetical protein
MSRMHADNHLKFVRKGTGTVNLSARERNEMSKEAKQADGYAIAAALVTSAQV